MNAFDRATAFLYNALKRVGGSAGRYERGNTSIPLTVIPGRTDLEVVDGDNQSVRAGSDDFTIDVADISSLGEPAPGDRVIVAGTTYELMDIPPDGCWRYSDPTKTQYRIHTRKVA